MDATSWRLYDVANQPPLFERQENSVTPRPLLKWAGGKTHLLPILRRCVPVRFGRYFEPFLGGGALFFDLRPQDAVLSDSNYELIHCYRTVRDRPEEVVEHLRGLMVSQEEFYRMRAVRPETLPEAARAARFIYLNKTCFNGLYRVNKHGLFNTPFGHYKHLSLVDARNLAAVSRALTKPALECADYSLVLRLVVPGDFVYMDPPYLPIGKYSDFKRYTREQFRESDHERLADVFRCLAQAGCFVLLSNAYHEKIARLFADFHQAVVYAPRNVNCKGKGRGKVKELLISNYPLPKIT